MRTVVSDGSGFTSSTFARHVLATRPDDDVLVLDALSYADNQDHLAECCDDGRFSNWCGNVTNGDPVRKAHAMLYFAAEARAARSSCEDSLWFVTDIIGMQTVANAVGKSDRARVFVHISTSEVYGTAQVELTREAHSPNLWSPHLSAKVCAWRLWYSYRAALGTPPSS